MADLAAQLEALRTARASGLRRVRFNDREIEYRSDKEIVAAMADLERRIADQTGRVRTVRLHSSKGF